MKNTTRSWLFSLFVLVGLLGLFSAAPANLFAQATTATEAIAKEVAPLTLDATSGAVVNEKPSAAPVAAPWWSGPEAISAIIALATGLFAVWQHKEKKTAQKVSESLVIAIEAATKIPAVAAQEKLIKSKIKGIAEDYGVGPVLHRLVKDVT